MMTDNITARAKLKQGAILQSPLYSPSPRVKYFLLLYYFSLLIRNLSLSGHTCGIPHSMQYYTIQMRNEIFCLTDNINLYKQLAGHKKSLADYLVMCVKVPIDLILHERKRNCSKILNFFSPTILFHYLNVYEKPTSGGVLH